MLNTFLSTVFLAAGLVASSAHAIGPTQRPPTAGREGGGATGKKPFGDLPGREGGGATGKKPLGEFSGREGGGVIPPRPSREDIVEPKNTRKGEPKFGLAAAHVTAKLIDALTRIDKEPIANYTLLSLNPTPLMMELLERHITLVQILQHARFPTDAEDCKDATSSPSVRIENGVAVICMNQETSDSVAPDALGQALLRALTENPELAEEFRKMVKALQRTRN